MIAASSDSKGTGFETRSVQSFYDQKLTPEVLGQSESAPKQL